MYLLNSRCSRTPIKFLDGFGEFVVKKAEAKEKHLGLSLVDASDNENDFNDRYCGNGDV